MFSDIKIGEELNNKNIVIFPFRLGNLGDTSYDVCLGSFFYRANTTDPGPKRFGDPTIWCSEPEEHHQEVTLAPGELILGHTDEFIGSVPGARIVAAMHARSTSARSGLTVCSCAGWGNVGYLNRWTMELRNHGVHPLTIPIGERVAQITFCTVKGDVEQPYRGSYSDSEVSLPEIVRSWRPWMMLPRNRRPFQLSSERENGQKDDENDEDESAQHHHVAVPSSVFTVPSPGGNDGRGGGAVPVSPRVIIGAPVPPSSVTSSPSPT